MKKWSGLCSIALVVFSLQGCARKTVAEASSKTGIQVTAQVSVNPAIIGLTTNPLVRIRVYVPENSSEVQYRSIDCELNQTSIGDIEKLEVFFTGEEPLFDIKSSIASIIPSATSFSIPIKLQLKPGIHYMWVSAKIKDLANMDHTIVFNSNTLVGVNNKLQKIQTDQPLYRRHIGIAVRKAGDDGVNTYRIPGIATTDRGTLIAVYDIRYKNSGDLPGNIDVGMSRSTDGGKSWSPMKVIMDMGAPHENNGVGDPSVLFDPVTKKIWVSALWSKGNRSIAGSTPGLTPDETGQFEMVGSSDDGLTWSAPHSITSQVKNPAWRIFFPGPGNGMAMENGNIVFPAQYWDEARMPHSTIVYSADHGKTWRSGTGAKSNTTESAVVETTPGTLMLNMRDNRGSFRSVATTANMGTSWTEHQTSYKDLIDPVCMGSLIKANVNIKGKMKQVLFFSNAATQSGRYDFTVKASLNLGESWLPANSLLVDERKSFGYSALTRIDENTIGALYEGTRDLYFVRLPVKEIIK